MGLRNHLEYITQCFASHIRNKSNNHKNIAFESSPVRLEKKNFFF